MLFLYEFQVLRTYRRATGGDRKPQVMRAAVSCSNSSNVFAHAKALYNICPAIVCKSHARYIQKSSKNLTQINEKSSPGRSESMQIRPCSTKSMPDCRQKLPESIFRWFWGVFWSPKWSGNLRNSMQIHGKLRSRLHIQIYGEFSWFVARQTNLKSTLSAALLKKADFVKIIVFL